MCQPSDVTILRCSKKIVQKRMKPKGASKSKSEQKKVKRFKFSVLRFLPSSHPSAP